MSSEIREYQALFSYLRSLNFHFLDSWVVECVNYYKTKSPNISFEALKNEVRQQWLLVNLRDIKVPSLPPDLSSKEKFILNGRHAVQVESMIDCSESCYSQFQKLRKVNDENIQATKEINDWNIKSKRCLVFVISDGVQELKAMEYETIKKIRTNDPELLPGFKMVIIGPVECRKGMLLLKEENVKICGGEVDTLTTTNNLKSQLIRKLRLNEEDYLDIESSQTDNFRIEESNPESNHQENESIDSLLSQNDEVFFSLPLESEVLAQQEKQETTDLSISNVSDYQLDELNLNLNEENVFEDILSAVNKKHGLPLEEIQTPTSKKISLGPKTDSGQTPWKSQRTFDSMDVDEIVCDITPLSPSLSNTSVAKLKKPVQTKLSSFFNSSPVTLNNKVHQKANLPVCINHEPFVYLKDILLVKLKQPVIFTIKAIVLTLVKKITIENGEFNLRATITDGSSSIDADFSSIILEDFLGFSPCEMISMMKAKLTNTAVADRVKEAFARAQEKLISLNCLVKIKFFPDEKVPVVQSLEEVDFQHVTALRERSLKDS